MMDFLPTAEQRGERMEKWIENFSFRSVAYWSHAWNRESDGALILFNHDDKMTRRDVEKTEAWKRIVDGDGSLDSEIVAPWFKLDGPFWDRAYVLGERRWGELWTDACDSERDDVVLQYALFGEVRYG